MLFHPDFLKKCEELKRQGFSFEQGVGTFVGRGFADLGYEVFSLISERKMVSLFTAQVTEIGEGDQKNLFVVPSSEELVNEIIKKGWDITKIEFKNQREWRVEIQHEGKVKETLSPSLDIALIDLLIALG